MTRDRVYITGKGVVNPLGPGVAETRSAMEVALQ